jgi:hypothetical protein
VRVLLFLACLGGAYGLLIPLMGEGIGTSAVAWPVGIALYFAIRASWYHWRYRRADRFAEPS